MRLQLFIQQTILLVVILLAGITFTYAQNGAPSIKGTVKDKGLQSIEYATVTLLAEKDSSIVKKAFTDASGGFKFENLGYGNYLISVFYLGYQKAYSQALHINGSATEIICPLISLSQASNQLKEVAIIGKKPLIELGLDKMIVNVQSSVIANGSTAAEILEKVPGVLADAEGNLSLMGKSGVKVLINGRPTHLSAEDLANRLKSIQGNSIDKVEVISNPSSRYDASGTGGIINLIMKKDANQGINGNISSSISYGRYLKNTNSSNFNYRNNKVNVFGAYSFSRNVSGRDFDVYREQNSNVLTSSNDTKSRFIDNSANIGVDYTLSKKTVVGLQLSGFINKSRSVSDNHTSIGRYRGVIDSGSYLNDYKIKTGKNFSVNLNGKHSFEKAGCELTTDIDFTNFDISALDNINTNFYYNNAYSQKSPLLFNSKLPTILKIRSIKADYTLPINKLFKTEMGLKSSYVFSDNNALFTVFDKNKWDVDSGKTNHFKYSENVNAMYFSASGKFSKWQVQAGFRAEHTQSVGNSITLSNKVKRDYLNVFPTFFITREVGKEQALNFSYSRRINRPNYRELNPFTYFIDNYTYYYGNPYLSPQYSNSFNLAYNYKSALVATLNYTKTKDIFTYIYNLETRPDSTEIWASSMGNLNSSNNYSLNVNTPLKLSAWWTSNNNVLVFYNDYNSPYSGGYLNNKKIIVSLNTSHTFVLPADYKAEVSANFKSPSLNGFHTVNPQSSVNIGIQKLFYNKKAKVSFNVSDILNKMQWSSNMYFNSMHVKYYNKWETRVYRLTLSYQLGTNTVKASKQRKSGSEEEKSRVEH